MNTVQKGLLYAILAGAVLGLLSGWLLGPAMSDIAWLGMLFLNALKMIIAPLVMVAVIHGILCIGSGRVGRTMAIAVCYYATTTGVAVLLGLVLVNLLEPGTGVPTGAATASPQHPEGGVVGIFLQMVTPPAFIDAMAGNSLLPVILFSLLLGLAMLSVHGQARTTLESLFAGLNTAIMRLVSWIMYLAPIGVFALIAARLGQAGGSAGIMRELEAIGLYSATVLIGLGMHFVFLSMLLYLLTKRGLGYVTAMARALVTAFGTASSSATLPFTISCATDAGVDKRSARFVLPLGATMNMDGTALYEAVAAVFIAQAYGIALGPFEQAIIFITATLAAVGAAGVPQAGLVTMVIVLGTVGLPLEGISLLLSVDWLLDRFRTTVNVWGDSVGAAIVARFIADAGADDIHETSTSATTTAQTNI